MKLTQLFLFFIVVISMFAPPVEAGQSPELCKYFCTMKSIPCKVNARAMDSPAFARECEKIGEECSKACL